MKNFLQQQKFFCTTELLGKYVIIQGNPMIHKNKLVPKPIFSLKVLADS